ncbi:21696_t:CDS:1, partial [Entrophospora sp. SA101]
KLSVHLGTIASDKNTAVSGIGAPLKKGCGLELLCFYEVN